jgi:hypothetical protein
MLAISDDLFLSVSKKLEWVAHDLEMAGLGSETYPDYQDVCELLNRVGDGERSPDLLVEMIEVICRV